MSAETIIVRIVTQMSALIGTADWITVERDIIDTLELSDLRVPALSIEQGDNLPISDAPPNVGGFVDSDLQLAIIPYAKVDSTEKITTKLNRMYSQIYAEMMADQTLNGTAFFVVPGGASKPFIEDDGETIKGFMETVWTIRHRHSVLDVNA